MDDEAGCAMELLVQHHELPTLSSWLNKRPTGWVALINSSASRQGPDATERSRGCVEPPHQDFMVAEISGTQAVPGAIWLPEARA